MRHPMKFPQDFDVIIVGGGHAGTEAALAAARVGRCTLLLTHSIETLGQMSCNPSIGGIGKGHLVKEVDALGGAMALATDEAGIQFRILNSSKGPAVRATRAQADRVLYKQAIRSRIENQSNLWLFQQAVDDLMVEGDRVVGAVTQIGLQFRSRAVVLTAGTFLDVAIMRQDVRQVIVHVNGIPSPRLCLCVEEHHIMDAASLATTLFCVAVRGTALPDEFITKIPRLKHRIHQDFR